MSDSAEHSATWLSPTELPTAGHAPGLGANKLGVIAIAFFVIAAAAPMAAVIGASPVLFVAVGPATPIIYLVAALIIAVFSVGYLRMSRHITNAGGFVAYIAKGLGNRWATAGAGIAIVTYLALQVGLWAQFGVFADQLVTDLAGVHLPPLVWILAFLIILTALTVRGVDASFKLLGVLIVLETAVIAALIVAVVATHGFGVFSFAGFTANNIFSPGLGIALLFAFLCFTTFEATVVFAEEAKNPRHTIPRALYLVVAFVGIFYLLSTWVISGGIGIDQVQATAEADPAGFIFTLATDSAGEWLSLAMQVLVVTSFIAMLLGIANMFARYLFALGRAGALPHRLSIVSRRGSPATAAITNAIILGIVISAFLLAGADPLTVVFGWFSALGTAGFITILILTSTAIIVFFARNKMIKENPLVTVVAPVLALGCMIIIAWLTLDNYSVLGGSDIAKWLLVAIPIFAAAGLIRSLQKPSIDYSADIF